MTMPPQSARLPDNVGIAVYALRLLGGSATFIHTEDVALKCFELVPERFSWRRYPQYPDAGPARFALEDAKKEKYGHLATGNRVKGWKLTTKGIEYADRVTPEIERLTGTRAQRSRVDRQGLGDIENHLAYTAYLACRNVEHLKFHEFTTMLRCPVDTPGSLLLERTESLIAKASDAGREKIVDFLRLAGEKYRAQLGKPE